MGAPVGNQNAAKAKRWQQALMRALARKAGTVDDGLDKIADHVVEAAILGNVEARDEIANRMDGKPSQAIVGDDDAAPIRMEGILKLVKP